MAGLCRTVSVLVGLLGLSSVLSADEPAVSWNLQCSGNEPFWHVEANGVTAKLTRPVAQGIEERVFQGGVGRVDYLKPPWIVWRGVETKEPIAVLVAAIREESCQDSMSGAEFDHRAVLSLAGEKPLVGCCRAIVQDAPSSPAGPGSANGSVLYGSEWALEWMDGREVPDSPRLFITFNSDGKVAGNAGCNQFAGQATVAGNSLRFGPLISTRRACADQAAMDREQRFLKTLERVTSWRVDRDLLLFDATGVHILRLSHDQP